MPDTNDLKAHLSDAAFTNVTAWLTQPKYAEYKDDLIEMIDAGQWQAIEDAFFKVIEFGTAGRRGTTGVGSNRINRVTVGESTQALCAYAKSFDATAPEKGVVIAYDTRLSSPELSRYAARVAAANGFKTYIFDSYRSTPELSFAVRHLKAAVGIVITASHNPPLDNGFKAYWSDGAQLVAPHDKGVLDMAAKNDEINVVDYDQAKTAGTIIEINKDIDDAYVAAAVAEAEGSDRDIKIVYSPLHGAGQRNTLPVLKSAGFTEISVVDDQMVPDGNFPTIENGKPNPEEKLANDRAVAQMLAENADIAITNDPDADRIGVIVNHHDEPFYLSGNQSAALATDYSLMKLKQKGELTPNHYVVKTIVTTDLMDAIAAKYGAKVYGNLLIGFKYVGELILSKETTAEKFVLGAEESFGLLKGDYARDKDGATGALPLAEYAAELKKTGKTLVDRLFELYAEYGLYIEKQSNAYFLGATGFETMQNAMANLRQNPPKMLDGHAVTAILDYQTLERRDLATGVVTPIDCIKGNVVVMELGDPRCRVTIRPSGTEPKLKFYVQWRDDVASADQLQQQYDDVGDRLDALAKTLEGMLLDS